MAETLSGIAFAIGSAIANGSFSVLSKIGPVTRAQVSPYVFNFWAADAVAWSGIVASLFLQPEFNAVGLLSGILFVVAIGSSFVAISLTGSVAVATGIWCGVAMCTSFFSGILTGERLNPYLSAAALVLMIYSVYRISRTSQISHREAAASETLESQELLDTVADRSTAAAGIASAVVAGVAGGLILFPMKFIPAELQGLPYMLSMSFGVFLAMPLCLMMQYAFPLGLSGAQQFRVAWVPGTFSGMIWNFGNACSIVATQHVGLAVAYPIMQCGLFVAAIWGIALFDEMKGIRIRFMMDSTLLICGVCLLGLARQFA
eukprot:jgi/Ulvmu1/4328/UM002_0051.1